MAVNIFASECCTEIRPRKLEILMLLIGRIVGDNTDIRSVIDIKCRVYKHD